MNFVKKSVVLLVVVFLTACGGLHKQMQWSAQPLKIDPAAAKMVFLRDSAVLGALYAHVYKVVDGSPIFLGTSTNGTQIEAALEPGHHVFMVTTGASHNSGEFMEAEVVAGKTYYAVVTPNWGMTRFFLHPVHRAEPAKFLLDSLVTKQLLAKTKPAMLREQASNAQRQQIPESVVVERYNMFRTKPVHELTAVTTRPEDGV